MADSNSEDRMSGVEFGDLADRLEDHDYPATTADIVDAYGDETLDLPDGETTVESVLGPMLADAGENGDGEGDTYESAEEVRQSIFTMVGDDAVGNEGYSDRGGQGPDEESESV